MNNQMKQEAVTKMITENNNLNKRRVANLQKEIAEAIADNEDENFIAYLQDKIAKYES